MRAELLTERRPTSVIRLAEQLFSTPIDTAAQVATIPEVTQPTAQSAIRALVNRGDLVEITGQERNRVYEAPRVFEAVYGSLESAQGTAAERS